jgi:lipopolysaccharide transport system permease protein
MSPALPETLIKPVRGPEPIHVAEVWQYRGLLLSMVTRDLRVKFDALHLGFFWPVVRPLMITLIIVFFKNATSAETGEALPYFLFVYAGAVFWFYFAEAVIDVGGGLQRDAALLMKVYYPRIISPLVSLFSTLVELGIQLVPLVMMMIYYRVVPGLTIFLFPLVMLQLLLFTLACGLILSYLGMHVRDFERAVGLVLYVGIFISPVFHDVNILPPQLRGLAELNPMKGTLEAIRAVLFDRTPFPWTSWWISSTITAVTLVLGISLFKRLQHKAVELL